MAGWVRDPWLTRIRKIQTCDGHMDSKSRFKFGDLLGLTGGSKRTGRFTCPDAMNNLLGPVY